MKKSTFEDVNYGKLCMMTDDHFDWESFTKNDHVESSDITTNIPLYIPNIIHFVFGLQEQTEEFLFCYYLAIVSANKINSPDEIYFHYHYQQIDNNY